MCRRRCSAAAASLVAFFAGAEAAHARPLVYVDADANPGGNGLTWTTAFNDLQDGIALAQGSGGALNEIWIAEGVYRPDRGTADRSASFTLFSGLIVRGGFAGTESAPEERVPGAHPTVLSGDIGAPGAASDNSYHVVQLRIFLAPATLDGLTISGGRADGASWPANSGGGMLNEGSPNLVDCIFQNNFAGSGGGLYSRFGAPTIDACTFRNSTASSEGAGAFVRDAGIVRGSTFSGNTAGFGGGLSTCCGPVKIRGCTFTANFASYGGGLYSPLGAAIVSNCVFTQNSASKGAGIFTAGSGVVVSNCFLGGNTGERGGGSHHTGAGTTIVNCAYSRNFATLTGGGLYTTSPSLVIVNCTAVNNNALLFGGGVYMESGSTALSNSIVWNNSDGNGTLEGAQFTRAAGTVNPRYNCMQAWTGALGGQGNLSVAPTLTDPDGADNIPGTPDDDLRPVSSSPCIDRAENAVLPADAADLDDDADTGEPVPLDLGGAVRRVEDPATPDLGLGSEPVADVGAFEFQPAAPPVLAGDADLDGDVDFADVTVVLANFGSAGPLGDVDFSGSVDFADITLVMANFGATLPPGP